MVTEYAKEIWKTLKSKDIRVILAEDDSQAPLLRILYGKFGLKQESIVMSWLIVLLSTAPVTPIAVLLTKLRQAFHRSSGRQEWSNFSILAGMAAGPVN